MSRASSPIVPNRGAPSVPHLHRGRLAAELAARALDDVEPLKEGPAAALAVSLLREAAYWALTATSPGGSAKTLGAAFDAADHDLLIAAAGNDHSVRAVREALVERTFLDTAEITPKAQERDARSCLVFVQRLIAMLEGSSSAASSVVGRRVALALAGGAVLGLALAIVRPWRPTDLAKHKAWRTSTQIPCDLTFGYCSGTVVNLLFHTELEDAPWAEVDLGRPQRFTSIQIRNREDCCKERAVPLVVEASDDGQSWRELARQPDEFEVWNLRFPLETARYLRFSVPRRTELHLKSVSVY